MVSRPGSHAPGLSPSIDRSEGDCVRRAPEERAGKRGPCEVKKESEGWWLSAEENME